jgi:outer membrane receptor protein involved in Fe transport
MKRNTLPSRLTLLCSAFLLSASVGLAQSTTQGAISGTVLDPTGAAIPSASVLIHNDATGADQTVTAGDSGTFRAPQLAPGTYTVTITAPNFAKETQKNVVVQVNLVTELNPHLSTGSEQQTVEVTAQAPVIQFESAQFGGHLDNKEIENIPINNRRWSSLALTTPAVVNDNNGFGLLSFRAISPILNVVEIDGADDNQAFFSEERGRTRAGYSTSQGAVREFQVNTGVYSTEFGRAVGGVVNSVTKSGSNQIHGEAYFYNRNSSRSAYQPGATNTVFDPATNSYVTSPYRPKDNRNQYGFAVGGPIKKDKIFWFYSFDAYRRNFPGTAKANNPNSFFVAPNVALNGTETCNATSGAFSGTPTVIQNGQTAASQASADAAACLLAARLNVAGLASTYVSASAQYNTQLQAFLPNLGRVPRFGNQLINTPKLDWQVNDKHHVSALYHRLRWDSPGGVQTQGTNNYAIDTFGTDFVKLDYGLAKLDSLITPRITNELRYQYGRELNNEGLQPTSAYTKANLINPTGLAPEISLNSSIGFMMGMPYYSFRFSYPDERKWQIGDTATWVKGRHSFRFGEDIIHNYDLQNNVFEGNGFITYSNTVNYFSDLLTRNLTGINRKACNASGSGVASGAANGTGNYPCYSSYAAGFGPSTFQLATLDYGFFVQDDWKLTPRLTVNLGVRYDYESFPSPYANLTGTAGNTLPQTTQRPSDKNNISPRVGFAWDPFGQGKTVFRGGFGVYYGRVANAIILNAYLNTGSALSQSTPSYTTSNTAAGNLPTLQAPPTGPAPGTRTAFFFDTHFQNPYTEQVDFAMQQDLGFHNVLSVSYLGAMGRELPNWLNVNLDPTETYNITYHVVPGANGSCGPVSCGTYNVKAYAGKHQGATANIGRIDPTFGSVTELISNINSNYQALSVDITNRSWKFITFDANYTWAHALDFNQTTATAAGTNNWIDPYANARQNYSNSLLNVPQRAVGWAAINVPGVRTDSALKYLANGWSLKPLVQIQNGLPYTALTTGTTPQHCYSATYVEADGTPGCLAPAGTGIAGTSSSSYLPFLGRNTFQQPRTIVVDLRAQKEFTFAEHYNLQLIGEAFNLANHQNITGVSTSAYAISTTQGTTPATTVNNLTFSSSSFGVPSSVNSNYAYSPRLVQLALRLQF